MTADLSDYRPEPVPDPDPIGELATALAKAQSEMPEVKKDATAKVKTRDGGQYSYSYATLGSVLAAVRPIFAKHGLALVQYLDGRRLVTELLHGSGQRITSTTVIPESNGDPQRDGSSLTYYRRYMVLGFAGIAPEDDTDAADVPPRTPPQEKSSPARSSGSSGVISEAQGKRLWAIANTRAKEVEVSAEEIVKAVYADLDVKSTQEILRGYYGTVCTAIEQWTPKDPAAEEGF